MFSSSEQISPSMIALTFGSESEIDSASAEKEANRCPLREHGHARSRRVLESRPFSIRKSIRDHRMADSGVAMALAEKSA